MWDPEQARQLSCDTAVSEKAAAGEKSYPDGTMIIKSIDGKEMPFEKVLEIRAYARKLKANSPKMKVDRINKKLEEKFKIKVI